MVKNIRRKRGGQPGNQNARKHGFYATSLEPDELAEFLFAVNRLNLDRELAVIRLKLKSVLTNCPDNRRVLAEITKMLTDYYLKNNQFNSAEEEFFKNFIQRLFFNNSNNEANQFQNAGCC